jgi:hypothetical protein
MELQDAQQLIANMRQDNYSPDEIRAALYERYDPQVAQYATLNTSQAIDYSRYNLSPDDNVRVNYEVDQQNKGAINDATRAAAAALDSGTPVDVVEATLAGNYDPFVVNAAVNEAIWRQTTLGRIDQGFRSIGEFQRQGGVSGWVGREIGEHLRESERLGGAVHTIDRFVNFQRQGGVSGWVGREIGEHLRESRIGGAIRAIEEVKTYSLAGSIRRAIRDRAIRSYRESEP